VVLTGFDRCFFIFGSVIYSMPVVATTNNNRAIVNLLLQEAYKARGGKGGSKGGLLSRAAHSLGYTMPGHGVRSVKKPGSRGGHPWTDVNGGVHYGPKPQGKRGSGQGQSHTAAAKKPAGAGGARAAGAKPKAPKPVTAHNHPAKFQRGTPESKLRDKRRMLTDLNNTYRTGVDKHGNPLSEHQLGQVKLIRAALRSELKAHRAASTTGASRKKEIAAKEIHTGVMVAFYLDTFSPEAAVKLQIPGGETWDALHITLAYLGDSTELGPDVEAELYRLVSEFARSSSPLEGIVSGIGLFNNTEEGGSNAFVALFDSPALPDFRTRLMGMLQANGIMPVQNHGFTPHITLQYVPKGQPLPQVELLAMPMIFNKVTVKWGDKRMDFTLGLVEKEVKSEIEAFAAEHKPFTIFKDRKGQYRWVGVSSSSARDGDGETISRKALADDVARKDLTHDYGPLNWWHTPIELGTCDFNAMDGPLLVESGTFKNVQVALAVEKAIAGGALKPAMSLEFKHDQPARKEIPIPGLVFNTISRVGRALLPAEIASNPLTRFQVYRAATAANNQEVEKSMLTDEEKRKKALDIFGPEFLSALENENEAAVKMAQSMNTVFKAMAPSTTDPAKKKDDEEPPAGQDQAAPVVDKADPALAADPALVADPAAVEGGGVEDGTFEDGPADDEADAIMQGLYDQIAQIVQERVTAVATEIKDALTSVSATSTKEVNDQLAANTLAMKEVATAFEKVLGENTALKARLDVLEGKQPPVIQQRISQAKTQPVTDPAVIAALKEQNKPSVAPNDPFKAIYDAWAARGIDPNQPQLTPQG
jgi:2'-5' RNA ligase